MCLFITYVTKEKEQRETEELKTYLADKFLNIPLVRTAGFLFWNSYKLQGNWLNEVTNWSSTNVPMYSMNDIAAHATNRSYLIPVWIAVCMLFDTWELCWQMCRGSLVLFFSRFFSGKLKRTPEIRTWKLAAKGESKDDCLHNHSNWFWIHSLHITNKQMKKNICGNTKKSQLI